ncbi:hypothetical protein AAVH_05698 [Aphelenchoides avenae]|nr:hypothetical protein AAVH_05698 [Aphelenchus avenae]
MLSRLVPAILVIVVASFYASGHGASSPLDVDSSTTPAPPACIAECGTTECFDHVNASANERYYECRAIVLLIIIGVTIGVIVFGVRWYRKRKAKVEPKVSQEQQEIDVIFPKTPVDKAIEEPAAAEPNQPEPKLTLQQLLPDNKKSTVSIDQALAKAGAQETEAVFLGEHRGDRDLSKKKRQKPKDDLETKEVFTDQAKIDEKHQEPQKKHQETTKETKVIRGKTAAADEPTKDRTMNDVPSNGRNTTNAPVEKPKNKKAANKETKEESTYDPTKEDKVDKALPAQKPNAGKRDAKKGGGMVSSLFYQLGSRDSPKKAQRALYNMAKDTLKSMIVLFGYILVIAFLRGPNAQLPALIGELCFMQCVDFTGAAFIVVAVLLEVPNLFCVAIVGYVVNVVLIPSLICEFGAELRTLVQYYAGIGDADCGCYIGSAKSLTIFIIATEACFAGLAGVAVVSRICCLLRVRRFMIKQRRAPVEVRKRRKYGTSV